MLSPVNAETFALALEQWEIWRRWETAYYRGQTTMAHPPALPEDRPRWDELAPLLAERLVIDEEKAIRKNDVFQKRNDPEWNGVGPFPLQVQWVNPA